MTFDDGGDNLVVTLIGGLGGHRLGNFKSDINLCEESTETKKRTELVFGFE